MPEKTAVVTATCSHKPGWGGAGRGGGEKGAYEIRRRKLAATNLATHSGPSNGR